MMAASELSPRFNDSSEEDDNGQYEGGTLERQPLLLGTSSETERTTPASHSRSKMADKSQNGISGPPKVQKKISSRQIFTVASILVCELCERLTYYSVVANMVLFCTSKLEYTSDDASVITLVFSGSVYLIPVIGGYVADTMAGKYNTILGSALIYVLGLFLLPASAVDYQKWFGGAEDLSLEARKIYFFLGLVFIAIGTGGIKANVGPFGAQQVDDLGSGAVQSYFNWFYWFINCGAVIAYSGVAYVQQEVGFDFGFLIPLLSMIVAIIVFMIAKSKYKHMPTGGSVLTSSCGVMAETVKGCNWDNARKRNGGSYDDRMVDGVIAVAHIIPIFGLVIVYWAVYSQMSTSLFLQSERMDISIGNAKLPAAMLNIFNTLIILILIPIMDRIVYPALAKIGKSPTHLQRMGIGMVLAALAMVYAAIMEVVRKTDIDNNGYIVQTLAGDEFNASSISMFAQIPEFAFIGSSEVFTSIAGLDFAYTQAPSFMQGLIMGMFMMTSGLGSYLASAIVAIVKLWRTSESSDWFPKEPNNGHMEYILILLAALTGLNLLVFIVVARWYKYKVPEYEADVAAPDGENVPVYENSGKSGIGYGADNPGYEPVDANKKWPPEWAESSRL